MVQTSTRHHDPAAGNMRATHPNQRLALVPHHAFGPGPAPLHAYLQQLWPAPLYVFPAHTFKAKLLAEGGESWSSIVDSTVDGRQMSGWLATMACSGTAA